MIYDAFISYRHAPLDMEIAKKVHTGLETYHVPGAVQKKTGKKKIERVFRDQDELPIGSDLNENIAGALRESEYLVVICSPETPGSYWVAKEIETFIQLHDRHHVLAVLVDQIILSYFLNSFWLSILMGAPYTSLLATRIVQTAILIPVELVVVFAISKALGRYGKKLFA